MRAFGVQSKDGLPPVRDQDWASPSMREFDGLQDRVQTTYAVLKPGNQLGGFSDRDVHLSQLPPILQVHQPTTENHSAVWQQATPQIGEVNRVEGLTRSQSQSAAVLLRERPGRKS